MRNHTTMVGWEEHDVQSANIYVVARETIKPWLQYGRASKSFYNHSHAGGGDKSSINPDIHVVLKLSIQSQTQSSIYMYRVSNIYLEVFFRSSLCNDNVPCTFYSNCLTAWCHCPMASGRTVERNYRISDE